MKKNITILFIIIAVSIITFVPYDTSEAARRGVLGCNAAGFGSVGSRTPSGAHVPVWDYATSYNTNILIYKECILDGVVNTFKEAAIARTTRTGINTINTGINGSPMFVENINTHFTERILNPRATQIYSGKETDNISAPFKQEIRAALQKSYEQRKNKPYESYTCPIESSKVQACLDGDFKGCGGLQGFYNFTSNPSCNPLFAYNAAQQYFDNELRAAAEQERMKLDWGRGFRSVEKAQTITLADGSTVTVNKIVTPGYLIAQYASQLLGTGLRQLENADEIDEIIGLLMSNIGTQMLANINGLSGLSQSIAGTDSYLDSIVGESLGRGKEQLVTLTLNSLNAALQNEATILTSLETVANTILTAKNSIRNTDLQCLDKVIAEAEHATKNELCISSMGTTTGCGVTVSRIYDYNTVETYESSRQRVSISGYARGSNAISTEYSGGGRTIGRTNTTVSGTYNKYTSAGQDLSDLDDGNISPFAEETTASSTFRTYSGEEDFVKTSRNGQPVYKFSYDLPDVTITAISPTSTVAKLEKVLDLKKNHTELVIESNSGTKYQVLAELYGHIGSIKKVIQDLQDAKSKLTSEQTNEAINAAEEILSKSRTDQSAFIFAEDMKNKSAAIAALHNETRDDWTKTGGWCSTAKIQSDWRNYIK